MDNLYIVMPSYNEAENISEVVEEWYPVVERVSRGEGRLVIVNDGSRDDTLARLHKLQEGRPQLVVIDQPNPGHGATILNAYHYALEHGADYIFQTDSDGQTRPNEFDAFWQMRKDYPVVIGYRNHREDGFSRIMVTKVLKLVLWLVFGPDRLVSLQQGAREVCADHVPTAAGRREFHQPAAYLPHRTACREGLLYDSSRDASSRAPLSGWDEERLFWTSRS